MSETVLTNSEEFSKFAERSQPPGSLSYSQYNVMTLTKNYLTNTTTTTMPSNTINFCTSGTSFAELADTQRSKKGIAFLCHFTIMKYLTTCVCSSR